MAVLEGAVVGGLQVLGAAEIGGQTGKDREFGVESEDYAVVEDLGCKRMGEGGGSICFWGSLRDFGVSMYFWIVYEL